MNKTALVIDREPDMQFLIKSLLEKAGLEVFLARTGQEGIQQYRDRAPDFILLNLYLNPPALDDSGLQALQQLREEIRASVIVYGATINLESMRRVMQLGAFDYIPTPMSPETLFTAIRRLLEFQSLQAEVERLRREVDARYSLHALIGQTPQMRRVFRLIEQIAPGESSVLLTGASGTGKELVARALHYNSERRRGPFMALNCSTLPESLAESELFGHERGAFTGAVSLQKGKLELAYGGTLFLDEIGEMPLSIQVKLLRVLDELRFLRVGGVRPISLNARIIAATNRNLERAVQEGRFRQDLFYRLNVFRIPLPLLSERREDIPLLVDHFLKQFAGGAKRLAAGVMDYLMRQPWPGNVRELRNAVERAVVMSGDAQIRIQDFLLPEEKGEEPAVSLPAAHPFSEALIRQLETQGTGNLLERSEEAILRIALEQTNGNKTRAAGLLGTHRKVIERRMAKYGL